jgi:DsbC/DsbD-like thiol-disulfide interchange protein
MEWWKSAAVKLAALLFLPLVAASSATPDEAATAPEIKMPELKPGERIATRAVVQPARFGPGEQARIFLKVLIAPGHYIYALKKSSNSSTPTSVELKLPDGLKLAGEWEGPPPEKIGEASGYRKEVVFRNRLVAGKDVALGKQKADIKVAFQVCNEAVCWPPESRVTPAEFELVKDGAEK